METEEIKCAFCDDPVDDEGDWLFREGKWFCCHRHYRYYLTTKEEKPYRQDWDESQ